MFEGNLPRYITFQQLRDAYGIPRSTAYRYMAQAGMPKPLQFGLNSVRFSKDEIEEWLANRPRSECAGYDDGVAAA